jgi:pimeloyl-[acyl-carrier protein] methyl ester esterase
VTLSVRVSGKGPNLVLLHGWALSSAVWGSFAERLAKRFCVHALDLPGHGPGRDVGRWETLAELAGRVEPCIPRDASILGWSLGGMVALELAASGRVTIDRLVLIATTPCFAVSPDWTHGVAPAHLTALANRMVTDLTGVVRDFLGLQARGAPNSASVLRELRARLAECGLPPVSALHAGLGVLRDADLRMSLRQVRSPALVVAGEYDRLTPPAAGRYLAEHLPAARFELIARAGHAPFISHCGALAELVLEFLAPVASAEPV